MSKNLLKSKKLEMFKRLSLNDLIIFCIPFLIFTYYLFIFNPGILTTDSFYQLYQIATSNFDNWHPFLHTFIEMMCLKVYANPKSIGILQITVFSTIWMVICNYFRQDPPAASLNLNKHFILQVLVTIIISLIPINAVYSITLWKDILFSYGMLFLCFLIKVMIDKNCQPDLKFIIIMSFVMACIAQLRANGIYVILMFLVVLAIYLYKRNTAQKLYVIIPACTVIFILLIASLNIAYDVEDNQKDALYAKTAHMLADYDLNLELKEDDADKLHEMIDEKAIKKEYVMAFSDPIYNNANETAYKNDKAGYLTMALKYSLKNPLHFMGYLFGSSPIVWDIVKKDDWTGGYAYLTHTNVIQDRFYASYYENSNGPIPDYTNATPRNLGTPQYDALKYFVDYVKTDKFLDALFDSPALYMYLAFIVLIAIVFLTKSKDMLLIYLPNLLNIIIVFFSIPAQQNRYLYPNLLIFYFLIIFLIGILSNLKEPL